jgi:hypothetical protein
LFLWLRLNDAGFGDCDSLGSLPGVGAESLDGRDNVHALSDFAENDVFAIKPFRHDLLPPNPTRQKITCENANCQGRRSKGRGEGKGVVVTVVMKN